MRRAPQLSPSRQAVRKAARALLLARPTQAAWQDAADDHTTFPTGGLLARWQAKFAAKLGDTPATGGAADARCAY
ncbi:MAG: hypothetical protein IT582_10025 [Opitutaceae bacterium]|nr:hypothetical protein [Opitutaceae bacterium]